MIVVDKPVEGEGPDDVAFRVFVKAIELLGGPRKIIEYRNLTWVPSLMSASYAVVLHDRGKTLEEIAKELGITKQTVQRMLSADPKDVMRKIEGDVEADDHTAGGIAKEAYMRLKAGEDLELSVLPAKRAIEAAGGPVWAVLTLTRIKGIDFPVDSPDILRERLRGIDVDGRNIEDLLDEIRYPIRSPAELLHRLKEASKSKA